jgi:sugar O-acyltransferase (sialic acid O-acetyltransferase NeuD family)
MVKKLLILGTGGNSVDILDAVHALAAGPAPLYQCVGFLDDHPATWGTQIAGVPVHGPLASACAYPDAWFVNGIGTTTNFWKKEAILGGLGIPRERFATIVHPAASVSQTAQLGRGTVILPNATICALAQVGDHVIVLPGAVVSHDDVIGDYTCIAGGACLAGMVRVGKACYLGANCAIRQRVALGDCCLVGMGAVVLGDVPENSVVVGSPARFLRPTRPV